MDNVREGLLTLKQAILTQRAECQQECKGAAQLLRTYKCELKGLSKHDPRVATLQEAIHTLEGTHKRLKKRAKQLAVPVTQVLPVAIPRTDRSEVFYYNGILIMQLLAKLKGYQVRTTIDKNYQMVLSYEKGASRGQFTLTPFVVYGSIFADYIDLIPTIPLPKGELV